MSLWKNTDANTSAPKFAPFGGIGISANGRTQYQNTTVGVFGVDTGEVQQQKNIAHAGWVNRRVGTGGRAGRVFYETLVAMGSMTTEVATSDDTILPDWAVITISGQPSNNTVANGGTATYSVTASVTGGTLIYSWERMANGSSNFVTLTANAMFQNVNTSTLSVYSTATVMTADKYRVLVTSASANATPVYSANATATVT